MMITSGRKLEGRRSQNGTWQLNEKNEQTKDTDERFGKRRSCLGETCDHMNCYKYNQKDIKKPVIDEPFHKI